MGHVRMSIAGAGIFAIATGSWGCSDPVPPTPQGAYQVTFSSPSSTCGIQGHNAKVGYIDGLERSSVVVDGDGASVSCTVSGSGTFAVEAQITKDADNLQIAVPAITSAATPMNPVKGRVAFASPTTVSNYVADKNHECNFYFLPGSKEGVGAGKIWVAFQCPEVVAQDSTCRLLESYVLLENCTQ